MACCHAKQVHGWVIACADGPCDEGPREVHPRHTEEVKCHLRARVALAPYVDYHEGQAAGHEHHAR